MNGRDWVVMCIPTLSEAGAKRTVKLIESVSKGTGRVVAINVIDNGGHFLRTISGGQWLVEHRVNVISPDANIGVGPAWNTVLRQGYATIFANDDITLAPDSIQKLVDGAQDGALMVATAGHGFSFFLMAPELVRRVGFFDEGFAPAYYEDTDYLRRMKLAGVERKIVETGTSHEEQSTSRDMGWDPQSLMGQQAIRYHAKWGGMEGREVHAHPWGIDVEVCVPSCQPSTLQRLIDSLAWQTARPSAVTIASNAEIRIDTRGLRVRQVKFWSDAYAIGEGDVSLRRNVATWAAEAPYLVYSDDDQVWPQDAMEWFRRRFATGQHFVVGHHRFVSDIGTGWHRLRNAKADIGASRERYPNEHNLWQSCWGGCVGVHSMLVKFGIGGWDMAYANGEDQQLARRIVGNGDESEIIVYEPPWAWHEKDAVHGPPWHEPHRNVCPNRAHDLTSEAGVARCSRCPLVRRDGPGWDAIQLYDPSKVRTEVIWL